MLAGRREAAELLPKDGQKDDAKQHGDGPEPTGLGASSNLIVRVRERMASPLRPLAGRRTNARVQGRFGAREIASSGHASTQSLQAWQASDLVTKACLPPCAQALSRPLIVREERSVFEIVPIVKTS